MTALELEWKQRTYDKLLQVLDLSLMGSVEDEQARSQIREIGLRLLVEAAAPLSLGQRQFIVRRIEDEVMGHGPLEPLLADPTISDILVNGADQVYVERRGKLERTEVRFNDDQHLLNIIDRIVSAVGRRIDESSPMVDARLADGSRVNAIIPPLALNGPVVSIRRFAVELLGVEDLLKIGTLTQPVADVLRGVVAARLNVLISGGTGAGKTTLLNILSGFIPKDERIVTIEDSAELQLQQPHVVRLETRPPNIEGRGEITQRDLVRNSLRMRPDRIVIGEVRGAEALDMLQAMNTGHDGSLTTVHANTARDALSRVENMVSMTGLPFPIKALRAQIASAIQVVVQVERSEDGKRRVTSVQEINGMEGDIITMSEIFSFRRTGIDEQGQVQGALVPTGVVPAFHKRLTVRGFNILTTAFRP
ncbi:MAG: CpaF family protein [Proteobacteria bacterium]|nr:CpaF family protein [Pseudomonadota bacterium]